ncbi:RNA polymerase sigma factor SigY [Isachenkonia alkalipeptolytica]|uniref:RNA polymerase sigma factor SigY n=1 Tax=Isachenkonia alkalipeptolytica TaxID=2565777 RepID=A0AA43XIC4_9CLOT|nr:RNA polymerase sigma factor SigY [Isachenkonia alkalipeptolytica]NBG87385.1 RNA polymerase sigma factor SigY [Isachenkonia alkalipeptolytica]
MTERELIKKAQAGHNSALNQLLLDNYSILKGYLIKLTLQKELAEDLTQETLLKAVTKIQDYEPRGKFSTWLIVIGKNLYFDYLRKNKNLRNYEEYDSVEKNRVGNQEASAEDHVISGLTFEKMRETLGTLSREKRSVFILKHYYGYSYKEIAEIEQCPIGTIRSRLHNSIEDIRRVMEEEGLDGF